MSTIQTVFNVKDLYVAGLPPTHLLGKKSGYYLNVNYDKVTTTFKLAITQTPQNFFDLNEKLSLALKYPIHVINDNSHLDPKDKCPFDEEVNKINEIITHINNKVVTKRQSICVIPRFFYTLFNRLPVVEASRSKQNYVRFHPGESKVETFANTSFNSVVKYPVTSSGASFLSRTFEFNDAFSKFSSFEGRKKCLKRFGRTLFFTAISPIAVLRHLAGNAFKWNSKSVRVLDGMQAMVLIPFFYACRSIKMLAGVIHPGVIYKELK